MSIKAHNVKLEDVLKSWHEAWAPALAAWSRFTKLQPPRWCFTTAEEEAESLSGSFAMIRLVDHAVVISLKQIVEQRLEKFPQEILAHEIGHHVYTPGDLADNARLIARTRGGLPNRERHAPLIANLYADLESDVGFDPGIPRRIIGFRDGDAYLGTNYRNGNGRVYKFDGSSWSVHTPWLGRPVIALWGLDPQNLWRISYNNLRVHFYDGVSLAQQYYAYGTNPSNFRLRIYWRPTHQRLLLFCVFKSDSAVQATAGK